MKPNFDKMLPEREFFTFTEIAETGLMGVSMAKSLLYRGELNGIRVGNRWKIPRTELIRYLERRYNMDIARRKAQA